MALVEINDFHHPQGWDDSTAGAERARRCCEHLEDGDILFFREVPFDFPLEDRQFLLSQKQTGSQMHKNISYRPAQDVLKGSASDVKEETERLHAVMRRYSKEVTQFLTRVLAPYAPKWSLDYASFRPLQEKGRNLSLHQRNDLLHVDAFPSRPTHGGRILRCFSNINPDEPRIWLTDEPFAKLAQQFAREAGLGEIAAAGSSKGSVLNSLKKAVGLKAPEHSAYDKFMLRFHDYLKENSDFQENKPHTRLELPSGSTWMCFTDSVAHAALSGQYALEQTFIIPMDALLEPSKAPLRVLESLAGKSLVTAS